MELAKHLRSKGYEVVELAGQGDDAPVEVLLVVAKRKEVPRLLQSIDSKDPTAYYTISDVKDSPRNGARSRRSDHPVGTKSKRM